MGIFTSVLSLFFSIKMRSFLIVGFIAVYAIALCKGHGMMAEPVGRASRWRHNSSAPQDWNDNEGYCGGLGVQNGFGGKCGICGDSYGIQTPRPHELGGLYGEGVIVKTYKSGDAIPVVINLTKNHWGSFTFDICNIDENKETEECFEKAKLADGQEKYALKTGSSGKFSTAVKLPEGLTCKHCVLRWTYRTANTWGKCPDGTGRTGCGPQEHFRSCADISIKA